MRSSNVVRHTSKGAELTASFQTIRYEAVNSVATITLDRPAQMNAATIGMYDEIVAALDQADADDDIRAIIVTGAGRAFCAGTDLSAGFPESVGDPATGAGVPQDLGGRVALRLFALNKPVIAAVNGVAIGFGATFILPMDIRIAAEGARVGYVFAQRGIVPEGCSSWFLPRIVGISCAMAWVTDGGLISAEEAAKAGLFSEVVAPDNLLARAWEIARRIAERTSPVSISLSRRLMWQMLGADHPMVAHRYESRALNGALGLADAAEGVASFQQRRPAQFTGRPSKDLSFAEGWWPPRPYLTSGE